ncbi:SURF1 family protein [Sphingomonas sp.]|uniref:SURF1 family protein n=1 Tax=Sphingomonas sp. TaxID=28214 RepID=UPI003B3A5724
MRRARARILLAALAAAAALLLAGLGVWQVERRAWKLGLIAQVERKLAAPYAAAPGPARWGTIGAADSYSRIEARGMWRRDADTYVQALTELGGGYWVMTPLVTPDGAILVNRGFIPPDRRGRVPVPAGVVTVRGLLRVTEPGGGFLRTNDPAADRWFSRDVAAIAARHGLDRVAPYFIDAAAGTPGAWPRGGLTVVRFRNSHLVYALTWFALAAMMTWLAVRVVREPTPR